MNWPAAGNWSDSSCPIQHLHLHLKFTSCTQPIKVGFTAAWLNGPSTNSSSLTATEKGENEIFLKFFKFSSQCLRFNVILFIENSSCCFCTKLKLSIKNHVNFLSALHSRWSNFLFYCSIFCKLLNTLICYYSKKDKKV